MLIHFLMMRQRKIYLSVFYIFILCVALACNSNQPAEKIHAGYDADAINSVLIAADSLNTFPFLNERVAEIKNADQFFYVRIV
jgi:predicted component of type VI protein secretion system